MTDSLRYCPREDCTAEFHLALALDYHLMNDHDKEAPEDGGR